MLYNVIIVNKMLPFLYHMGVVVEQKVGVVHLVIDCLLIL